MNECSMVRMLGLARRFMASIKIGLVLGALLILTVGMSAAEPVLHDSVLTVGRDCTRIRAYAYTDRSDIRELRIEAPTEIGEYAFMGCGNLRKVVLPESAKGIKFGAGAFRDCTALEEIRIPAGTASLPYALFYGCSGLRRVSLPVGLREIGAHAFAYCSSLDTIAFPSSLTKISNNAFSRCISLNEVALPSSVTLLDSYAFSDCESLRRITLPANSHQLGELILSGCSNLEEIRESSPLPPAFECNSYLFEPDEALYSTVRLTVPPASRPKYSRAPAWRLFTNLQ